MKQLCGFCAAMRRNHGRKLIEALCDECMEEYDRQVAAGTLPPANLEAESESESLVTDVVGDVT